MTPNFLIGLMFFFPMVTLAEPDLKQQMPEDQVLVLKGTIGSSSRVTVLLMRQGAQIKGSYKYDKNKDFLNKLDLRGVADGDGVLNLNEFDPQHSNSSKTGIFRGKFKDSLHFSGTWSKPNGTRVLPLKLEVVPREFVSENQIINFPMDRLESAYGPELSPQLGFPSFLFSPDGKL
jgi:hypothetical protein